MDILLPDEELSIALLDRVVVLQTLLFQTSYLQLLPGELFVLLVVRLQLVDVFFLFVLEEDVVELILQFPALHHLHGLPLKLLLLPPLGLKQLSVLIFRLFVPVYLQKLDPLNQ